VAEGVQFTGTTVLRLKDGKIVGEIGQDDGVTALQQLGLMSLARDIAADATTAAG
jgi:hypothetical protein